MPPAQVPSVRCQIHASQILRSLVMQQRGSKGCPPVAGCSASLSSSVLSLNLGPRSQGPQLYQEGPEVRDSPGESLRFRIPSPRLFPFMVSEPQGSLGSLLLVQHWLGVGHLGTQGPQLTDRQYHVQAPTHREGSSKPYETLWEICRLAHHTFGLALGQGTKWHS